MSKRTGVAILATIHLDHISSVPLYHQLYDGLRRAILAKQLLPGTELPSTRSLATELGVSRNTVLNAFEQLMAEGYLETRHGSGTYVAPMLPDDLLSVPVDALGGPGRVHREGVLSQCATRILAAAPRMPRPLVPPEQGKPRAFRQGVPALDAFPHAVWGRLLARCWRRSSSELFDYGDYWPLREAIAAYLGTARGVRCTAEQIVVVAGSQQGLDLAARMLLDPGDAVWIEDPGYPGAFSY